MIELFHSFWFLLFATIVITTTVTTIAAAWQKVRRAEQEAALKQDMLRRGLSAEEIERVLLAKPVKKQETSAGGDNEAIEDLAECLGESQVSPKIIEQIMAGVQAAEPSLRQALACAVRALIRGAEEAGAAVEDEHILAVVRGLSRPVKPSGQHEPTAPANTAIQRKPDPELEPIEPV